MAGLAQLKNQGYDIYMLADIPDELHQIVKKYEGYQILSGGVFSHEEHMRKPDIRMYQTLLDRYGLKAEECVMIDDESAYLKPAERLGMKTIRFTNADDTMKKLHELLK